MRKLLLLVGITMLSGCMTPIGEPEFTCPNEKKGGTCAGPRDIYELTNTRENLENLHKEAAYKDKVVVDDDGHIIAVDFNKENTEVDAVVYKANTSTIHSRHSTGDMNATVYEARENTQQTNSNYQPATAINTNGKITNQNRDGFQGWPSNVEPLAPEPLAVLSAPKVMRILIASYKDDNGHLNMPGYVYVQVEPEVWSIGEAANLRPTRVVPLKIREKTQQENNKRKQKLLGVSPIEHMEKEY